MIKSIFKNVALLLLRMANKTGLTYNQVNIIVYYLLIPLSWTLIIDYKFHKPYTTIPLLLIWSIIIIIKRHTFRQWCDDMFMHSVNFLNWFNRIGGNYILNSVIICVVVPIIIYILLLWYALNQRSPIAESIVRRRKTPQFRLLLSEFHAELTLADGIY